MARPRQPRRAAEQLGEDQKPSEALEPAAAAVVVVVPTRRFPSLIPEGVLKLADTATKLQYVAGGIALFFAAVAVVVQRHEQRYHSAPPVDLDITEAALD